MRPPAEVARWALRAYAPSTRSLLVAGTAAIAAAIPPLALHNALRLELLPYVDLGVAWSELAIAPPDLQRRGLAGLSEMGVVVAIGTAIVCVVTLWALCASRAVSRRREIHIRRCVGATRFQLLTSATIEGAVLAALAAALGVAIGLVTTRIGLATWPGPLGSVQILAPALSAIAVVTTLFLTAVIPGMTLSRMRPTIPIPLLPPGLPAATLQFGVCCAVLLSATQLNRIAHQMLAHRTPSVVTYGQIHHIDISGHPAERSRKLSDVIRHSAAAEFLEVTSVTSPGAHEGLGVVDAAITDCGRCSQGGIATPLRPVAASVSSISADSFQAMNLSVIAGRPVADTDDWDGPRVAVVNHALATAHFENGEAVGRQIQIGLGPDNWFKVVGVVKDRKPESIGAALQPPYVVYTSVLQMPPTTVEALVRGRTDAKRPETLSIAGAVRRVGSEEKWRADKAAPLQWFSVAMYLSGALLFVLAMVGTTAVMQLWISELAPELALRRAVGACRRHVFLHTFSRVGAVAAFGMILGLVLADVASIPLESVAGEALTVDVGSAWKVGVAFLLAAWAGVLGPTWHVSSIDLAGALPSS